MKNILSITLRKEYLLTELKSYIWVFIGSLILSVAYVLFIIPHNVVPGGILGLSIVINEITGLSIGLAALFINIPLLLWGTKVLGAKTGVKTAFSMVLVSFFIDLFSILTEGKIFIDDVLVSSVFGGVIIGLCVSIVMRAGATTGGNDILVRILATKIKMPYSQLILIIDGLIILLGTFVFKDFTMAAYSVIAIIAISKTIEYNMNKSVQNKTLFVFSPKNVLIQEELLKNNADADNLLKMIHKDTSGKMILITKNTKKLEKVKDIIYNIDPGASITVLESIN